MTLVNPQGCWSGWTRMFESVSLTKRSTVIKYLFSTIKTTEYYFFRMPYSVLVSKSILNWWRHHISSPGRDPIKQFPIAVLHNQLTHEINTWNKWKQLSSKRHYLDLRAMFNLARSISIGRDNQLPFSKIKLFEWICTMLPTIYE